MPSNDELLLLVRLDTPAGEIRLHTGIGSPFPKGHAFHNYLGVGRLLSISAFENNHKITGNNFSVELAFPSSEDKAREKLSLLSQVIANEAAMVDRDVCIHLYRSTGLEATQPEPELLVLARTASISVTTTRITLDCYRAAAQLDRVYNYPTTYSDVQQRTFVDAADYGLQYANVEFAESGVNFP